MTEQKIEDMMIFAASCVECAARAEGVSSRDMYERMKRVNLVNGYILRCYEAIHSESREHVTQDIIETLHNWESKRKEDNL